MNIKFFSEKTFLWVERVEQEFYSEDTFNNKLVIVGSFYGTNGQFVITSK